MALKNTKNQEQILQERFNNLSTQAELARSTMVNDLKAKKATLIAEITRMTDFNPTSADSLMPNIDQNWDSNQWASNLQKLDMDLWYLERQIEIAESRNKELFA